MGFLQRMLYNYTFRFQEVLPLMEFQQAAIQEASMGVFMSQPLLGEELIREAEEEEVVLAKAASMIAAKEKAEKKIAGKQSESKYTYVLTYYNPEKHEVELLETTSDIKIEDVGKRMIEESVGMKSTYPIYTFIGAPIVRKEIVPWKLEKILEEREYGTPPPSGGGAPVMPMKVVKQKKSEIVAVKKREEEIREAIAEAVLRKEKSEVDITEEILLLEEAVEALRNGESVEKVLAKLPPLSRARYLMALRRLRLGKRAIIKMLVRDLSFLKKVKKKLETFTISDLLNMVKILRKLRKKE